VSPTLPFCSRGRAALRFSLLVLALLPPACGTAPGLDLSAPERVADGVHLYRLDARELLDPPGPAAVQLLRLDPFKVELRGVLGHDEVMGLEGVLEMATRHGAVAAVNAGFFGPGGAPAGVLKVDGRLVSVAARPRGAVGITRESPRGPLRLIFDRVTVAASIEFETPGGAQRYPIAGIDSTRRRGHLTLFTPRYHADTDTAPAGTEWILDDAPLRVVERRSGIGKAMIPREGAVLSFGSRSPPAPLDELDVGGEVTIHEDFQTAMGTAPEEWAAADAIVGGAGLLRARGRPVADWDPEDLRPGFTTERHPRTMIGTDRDGGVWLITVDGRAPNASVGMNFDELQRLASELGLREALNLDGGGSTTMVVSGAIVNRPSDPSGPRPVSDALLVLPRRNPGRDR
jgi:hypothetical protein